MHDGDRHLERSLGLYSVFAISVGAMIGSGIFVLPGLAAKVAGPGVVLAYFLAGLVVLPAALSKSEMATAMPEAGGTYLYIDRAMGPLMGTIAGIGVWFSLVFKAAFALVGLGAYLGLLADMPVKPVAIGITIVLTVLNTVGVKQASGVQAVLVSAVMIVLGFFVVTGVPSIDGAALDPLLPNGFDSLLAATGLVFVSYAGVTKVASVAEEVKRPERNLPLGILVSVGVMLIVYPAIVLVVVGASSGTDLTTSLTPVATVAETFLGGWGVDLITITAIAALISMANAGILASSRYPFAMSRNGLAPRFLQRVGRYSGTPTTSIVITGGVMVLLIAFIPLIELAKLASAFQLLVFSLVNIAVIAFREADLRWYRPRFRSPLYPWVQLAGIAGSVVLLSQMGIVSIVGALGIVVGGVAWYQAFGRSRASRESASLDAVRERNNSRLVALTDMALHHGGKSRVLIPMFGTPKTERARDLLRVAGHLVDTDGQIDVVWFGTPDEIREDALAGSGTPPEQIFIAAAAELGIDITTARLAGDDRRHAAADYVWDYGVDLVLADMPQETEWLRPVTRDLKWLRDNLECDTVFLRNRGLESVGSIVIMGSGGPYDVLKISMANRIANEEGSRIRFVHVVNADATEAQIAAIRGYHRKLDELTEAATSSEIERSENLVDTLFRLARGANLVIIGAAAQRFRVFSDLADRIAEGLDCPVLLVHARDSHRRTLLGRILERFIY